MWDEIAGTSKRRKTQDADAESRVKWKQVEKDDSEMRERLERNEKQRKQRMDIAE